MKAVFRFCVALLMVSLVVTGAMTTTHAQGNACLPGLQAADCDLMTAASKGSITSMVMDYALTVNVTGLEGVKSGSDTLHDLSLNVTGNGPYSLDKTKLPANASAPTDLTSLMSDAAALTLGNTIKVDLKYGPTALSRSLEFRIIDSKVYYMGDSADMYPTSQKNLVGKWLMTPIDPSTLSKATGNSSMSSAMMGAGMMNSSSMAQMQAMMQQFATVPGFITATRSDANDEATITINVDIATLLKSPQFKPILTSIMASMGNSSQAPDDSQMTAMLTMFTPYFENLKITATDVIGTQDQLTHGIGFHLTLALTAQQLQTLAAMGGKSGSAPQFTNPLNADINFSIKLSNLNQPITLAAPEGAVPVASK